MIKSVTEEVARRARGRCEYCRVPQSAYLTTFQIDHIIARQHGGVSELENFAFACFHCNRHKGPNIASVEPTGTTNLTRLFHPRRDVWSEHFLFDGAMITGISICGFATARLLNMNDPAAAAVRLGLIEEGIEFPG